MATKPKAIKPVKRQVVNGPKVNLVPKVRRFEAAKQSNVTQSFKGSWGTADAELIRDLPLIRARSRQMSESNPYMQSFIGSYQNNVLGPKGFNFQCKIMNQPFAGDVSDNPDTQANDIVESFWKKVGSATNYSVTRDMSRRAAYLLMARTLIVDGEIFVRTFIEFDNGTRIARQLIPAEICDMTYNVPTVPGTDRHQIRMGIETDKFGAKVAYYFLRRPKNDYQTVAQPGEPLHERVPASEVMHLGISMRAGQTRFVPLLFASLLNLRMLGLFEEAALINAKIGASRNLFFTKEYPTGFSSDDVDSLTETGAIVDDLKEGESLELPYGVKPQMVDTRYPSAEIDAFNKCMMRGIAAGANTDYMTLSGDLSEANFSSLRAGLNESRSQWESQQEMWKEKVCIPEFEADLRFGLATQQIKLPPGRFDKYNKPVFTGRRWQSVNPLQDAQADDLDFKGRRKSISQCIRERGQDPDEVFEEIARDTKRLELLGISVVEDTAPVEPTETEDEDSAATAKKKKKAKAA